MPPASREGDLIVGATRDELGTLAHPESALATLVVGVGLVEATRTLALALASAPRPRRVIFVGSAGALPGSGLAIGALVSVRAARLVDGYDDSAYLPRLMATEAAASVGFGALPAADAVNRLGVSRIAPPPHPEPRVENMEVFAVLHTAARAGIPAGAILAVSNQVGPQAHTEWRLHAPRVLAELWSRLPALLAADA